MANVVRLLKYLRPQWRLITLGFLCLLVSTPAHLFPPLVWKYVVDDVVMKHRIGMLLPALAVMLVVQGVGIALSGLRTYVLGLVGQRFVRTLRNDLYERVQAHALAFFHRRRSGDLIARVMGDVDTLEEVIIHGVDEIVSEGLQFIGVAGILLALNWQLGLVTLLPMAGVATIVAIFNHKIRGLYRAIRDQLGSVSAKLQENLSGILVIKAFGREPYESGRFREESDKYLAKSIRGVKARAVYFPSVFSVGFLSSVAMIGLGAWFVIKGRFTLGGLVAYRGYWWHLFSPVYSLAQINEMVQRALAAASRLFEIIDEPVEITDAPDARDLAAVAGRVECDHLSFAHAGSDRTLHDVTWRVEPGQKLGITGPSGSGKTTILSLLLRLYDPKEGRILLDGTDLRAVTQASLRRHLAVVTQEPFLFNETIRANICYGRLDATEDEIVAAARLANAHEFIQQLPQGYETVAGERGVKLSGGQKQRICIARAFLVNPRVLLLDEATASVEPESEAIIQAALERLMSGRTTVIVSHRLSMVRDSHIILVLQDGRVTEQGRHDELMAAGGWYARMYRLQMGEND